MSDPVAPAVLADLALSVARDAAAHVRRRRPELFPESGHDPAAAAGSPAGAPVATKSTPTDPVTVADTETEALIRARLHAARPGDDFLGEEAGGGATAPSGVRWVVDPIDGTVNFLYGIPAYAISIAAQVDGVSVAGAVIDVARDIAYYAWAGGGAWALPGGDESPRQLTANPLTDLSLALVATGFGYAPARRRAQGELVAAMLPQVRDIRRIGAAALDLCMVASGAVDAHVEHGLSPWDWAAGGLIAAEAGAITVLPAADSRSVDGAVTVAAAPGIAEAFTAMLTEVGGLEALPEA